MPRTPSAPKGNALRVGAIVEYENSGVAILGTVVGEKKSKWQIKNLRGGNVELAADRLYLLDGVVAQTVDLEALEKEAEEIAKTVDLQSVWEVVQEQTKEFDSRELAELVWQNPTLAQLVAMRRALVLNKIYFKRKKVGFEARDAIVVEELTIQARVEEEKAQRRRERMARLCSDEPLSQDEYYDLALVAALGNAATDAKDTVSLIDELSVKLQLPETGRAEDRARRVLLKLGLFSPHENLAVYRYQRRKDFSKDLLAVVQEMSPSPEIARLDKTDLDCISIDAEETTDIDDALSLEQLPDGYRVGIHISDVAGILSPAHPLFQEALDRGSSVYCPDFKISMLPITLSEDRLSLIEGERRPAMSFFIDFNEDGIPTNREIARTWITVKEKMNYTEVDEILFAESANVRSQMLQTLWQLSSRYEQLRLERGALQIPRKEMVPVVRDDDRVVLEEYSEDSPSRKLVGEFMVLANETGAMLAQEKNVPLFFRSQEAPESDIRSAGAQIPDGPARDFFRRGLMKRSIVSANPLPHSSLGLGAYAQMTSPIRRIGDLINQLQIGSALAGNTLPFGVSELEEINLRLQTTLDEVQQIQREGQRYWLLKYLQQEQIRKLNGVVVRIDGPKPLVEIQELGTIAPFVPLSSRAPKLGDLIGLSVDGLDPQRDVFTLKQLESPNL